MVRRGSVIVDIDTRYLLSRAGKAHGLIGLLLTISRSVSACCFVPSVDPAAYYRKLAKQRAKVGASRSPAWSLVVEIREPSLIPACLCRRFLSILPDLREPLRPRLAAESGNLLLRPAPRFYCERWRRTRRYDDNHLTAIHQQRSSAFGRLHVVETACLGGEPGRRGVGGVDGRGGLRCCSIRQSRNLTYPRVAQF